MKITHDLPRNITSSLGALPRTITAEVKPAGEQYYTVTSTAREDGTGQIYVDAYVDIGRQQTNEA